MAEAVPLPEPKPLPWLRPKLVVNKPVIRKYAHWRRVPESAWHWPNFHPSEIACKGTGQLIVHYAAMDALQRLRELMGHPLRVNSAYRSPIHNARVGGSPRSRHKLGIAFDVSIRGVDKAKLARMAIKAGFRGFGFYNSFLHVDISKKRWWGKRWNF